VDECKPLEHGDDYDDDEDDDEGGAVQVAPIKPTLKAPGTQRLKLEFDDLLSTSAFKFNLRRYTKVTMTMTTRSSAGAYTRSHFRST